MTASDSVLAFVDRINGHDVEGLCALLDEGHVLVEGLGRSVVGRAAGRDVWEGYVATVPDYWIRVDGLLADGAVVGIFGSAGGPLANDGRLTPENRWEVPAAWRAIVWDGGIASWQVFADKEPVRAIVRRMDRCSSGT
jgi:hypothetical protein